MNQYELADAVGTPFFMEIADKIKTYENNVASGYDMDPLQRLGFVTSFRRVVSSLLVTSIVKGISIGVDGDEEKAASIMLSAIMQDVQKSMKKLYPNMEFVVAIRTKDGEL